MVDHELLFPKVKFFFFFLILSLVCFTAQIAASNSPSSLTPPPLSPPYKHTPITPIPTTKSLFSFHNNRNPTNHQKKMKFPSHIKHLIFSLISNLKQPRSENNMSTVFRLGRKMVKPTTRAYLRLNPCDQRIRNKKTTKICNWVRRLTGQRKFVPKGHVAVYVGQKYDDLHRYLVPVIYFNHPLFGELLREVEEEYGFYHPGGITIPCRIFEFERVQMRIAGESGRKMMRRVWSS